MTRLLHRDGPSVLDALDWTEPWTAFWPFPQGRTFRVEDYVEDGIYVVRAELPGLDPAKDIQVSIEGDILTISAERREEHKDSRRSEFRYGSLTRSIRLPAATKVADVKATYDNGILEVTVPVPQAEEPKARQVEITRGA